MRRLALLLPVAILAALASLAPVAPVAARLRRGGLAPRRRWSWSTATARS